MARGDFFAVVDVDGALFQFFSLGLQGRSHQPFLNDNDPEW
jgi:hypothetical protein